MSIRLKLAVAKFPDINLLNIGIITTRIFCSVKFEYTEGHSYPTTAIIDTGAPLSVIPLHIWERCRYKVLDKTFISGIIPGEKHTVPCKIGIVSAMLLDKEENTYTITFRARFAPSDGYPLLLGVQDILDKTILHIDLAGEENWLEFRK